MTGRGSGLSARFGAKVRIARAAILATAVAALAAAQTHDPAAIAAALDPRIRSAVEGGRIAGMTVAVVRGRDTLLLRGYGRADLELGVPTPDRAVYQIGSITKQFTAAAILQLQERGRLSVNDTLGRFVPGVPAAWRGVPLRRLMDHTSGIPGFQSADSAFRALMTQALPRDTFVALQARRPTEFAPGGAMAYNNFAYFLLGLVVERASGVPYEAYLRDNLFAPAGMRDSRYCTSAEVVPRRVQGYDAVPDTSRRGETRLVPAPYMDPRWGFSAGSLCSTAADLVAWTQALHGGRILGPEAYRALVTPEPLADGTVPRYGKGLVVRDIRGHRALHHGGSIYGFTSHAAYLPDDSLTLVVLMNTRSPDVDAGGALEFLVQTILGDATPAGLPFAGPAADYAGEYRGGAPIAELVFTVAADSAGALTLRTGNGRPAKLVHFGGETFGRGDARFTFVREGGRVTQVRFDGGTRIGMAVRQP